MTAPEKQWRPAVGAGSGHRLVGPPRARRWNRRRRGLRSVAFIGLKGIACGPFFSQSHPSSPAISGVFPSAGNATPIRAIPEQIRRLGLNSQPLRAERRAERRRRGRWACRKEVDAFKERPYSGTNT